MLVAFSTLNGAPAATTIDAGIGTSWGPARTGCTGVVAVGAHAAATMPIVMANARVARRSRFLRCITPALCAKVFRGMSPAAMLRELVGFASLVLRFR